MNPTERLNKMLLMFQAEPSERTLYNFGRGLTCALLEVNTDKTSIKAYLNTQIKNEEYRRGALDELKFWE